MKLNLHSTQRQKADSVSLNSTVAWLRHDESNEIRVIQLNSFNLILSTKKSRKFIKSHEIFIPFANPFQQL